MTKNWLLSAAFPLKDTIELKEEAKAERKKRMLREEGT